MRARYLSQSPLLKLGKKHPQSPPLHLHFDQSETFLVASGRIGTTTSYSTIDRIWTPENAPHEIPPWEPHNFWPVPDSEEDCVIYVWAHPESVAEPMDWLFFRNLLWLVSDMTEGKRKMDPLQIMLLQHISATALVWFPGAWWLGPLRWWVPYQVQAGFAGLARLLGYRPLLEEYTPKEHWGKYLKMKKT
ncbi:hypothetical protein B0J11DRAFT_336946 [Dendryphion nanum]|uniref:Uncharacterized protein n=1 Tax=Dendryphion nanum TaxID=256645 RepID=A0A9P9IJ19_9PLEO|nr:hypothetical protein B0J11DRAFT_336946 [Dendryphion nanum]